MIKIIDVSKVYKTGEVETHALKNINLTINDGELVVILGPSGSGKSTLLNVISGLDKISSGRILFQDIELTKLSDAGMTKFRREHLGFIFQQFNLLQNLTVYENIQIGSDIGKQPLNIDELLPKIGLEQLRNKYPYQLSGGEQQRVSIARSIAKNPNIIFCDEPTGALDEENSRKVLALLQELNRNSHNTIVIITHNIGIAEMAHRVIKMNSGEIIEIVTNETTKDAWEINWG